MWTVSRPSSRRVAAILLAAVALAIALVLALDEWRREAYAKARQYDTMCTIGDAAVDYLREKREVPRRLQDLVQAGFLYLDASAHTMMSSLPGKAVPGEGKAALQNGKL